MIAAAQAEFSRSGYKATTTRVIAARAGCSEALIQNYFGGKEGLLFAVMRTEEGGMRDLLDPSFFGRPRADDAFQEADALLGFVITAMHRLAPRLRILLDRVLLDHAFAARFAEATPRRALVAAIADRLRREWPDASDPDAAAEAAVSLGFELGFVHSELLGRSPAVVTGHRRAFAEMLATLLRS